MYGKAPDSVVSQLCHICECDLNVSMHGARSNLSGPVDFTLYLALLCGVGQHDYATTIHLPNHTPEVTDALRNGTLSGDVRLRLHVSLEKEE